MIDTSAWKEFRIGDLLIDESLCVYGHNKKWAENENPTDKSLPVISGITVNNGIYYYTDDIPNKDEVFEDCLTITTRGEYSGTLFYHKGKFVLANNILTLPFANTNELTSLFLKVSIEKLGYGGYDNYPRKEVLINDRIKLPATSDGQPDWEYMESYMKAVMEESEKSLENLRKADDTKHLIDVSGWGEFRVGDLFDKLNLKCLKKDFNKAIDCSEEQTDEFSLPLTNAKHFNNGIQFYGRPDDWESAEMTIDIVSNGAIATGDVYAQPQRTGVLWDSYLVKCKYDITSELVLQYMSCVIQRCVKQYFGWNDKCTWDKVKEQMIRLPITSTGEPDWQYMEDYMRRIMDKSEQIISDLRIGAKL